MSKVLCFGEVLLRLSPQLGDVWIKQNNIPVFIGGAELNTATALSIWGVPVAYYTALPNHYLSQEVVQSIKNKGIGTEKISFRGNRIGTYYLPQGEDLKGEGVIYDRTSSSFWDLEPGQLDWDQILDGISWFNFSAISPALNANLAAVCKEGAEAASKKGITVSLDLNHRSRLWNYGKTPHEVMPELMQYCDVLMGNIWAEAMMLGIPVKQNLPDVKEAYLEQAEKSSEEIIKQFPKCKQVANTFRFDRAEGLDYYATLYTSDELFVSNEHHAQKVIDRVGSGDTFMAGMIYGNYHHHSPQQIIEFAAAAAFNKLFIKGDATTATVQEIKESNAPLQ